MADILTPSSARKTEEFTPTQIDLVRIALKIGDNPFQTDRTYIVLDATVGNNNLHLDTGSSTTYSIDKGEGGLIQSFTDTGGTKVLNYTDAGRYLITIIGPHQGIQTDGETQADKNKLISVVGGSNYPTTIPANAFDDCQKLEFVRFDSVDTINTGAFVNCFKLVKAIIQNLTSLDSGSFNACNELIEADFPLTELISGPATGTFVNCFKLKYVNLPLVTGLDNNMFNGCKELESVTLSTILTLTSGMFDKCKKLKHVYAPLVTTINSSFANSSIEVADFPLVTSITGSTFQNCIELERVSLPALTSIGNFDFDGCTALKILELSWSAGLIVSIGAATTPFTNVRVKNTIDSSGTGLANANALQAALVAAGMAIYVNHVLNYWP